MAATAVSRPHSHLSPGPRAPRRARACTTANTSPSNGTSSQRRRRSARPSRRRRCAAPRVAGRSARRSREAQPQEAPLRRRPCSLMRVSSTGRAWVAVGQTWACPANASRLRGAACTPPLPRTASRTTAAGVAAAPLAMEPRARHPHQRPRPQGADAKAVRAAAAQRAWRRLMTRAPRPSTRPRPRPARPLADLIQARPSPQPRVNLGVRILAWRRWVIRPSPHP
mmetsp:Transcript_5726/g.16708  ORF Transcript_5726/g.16708 Transcript_5726/m.16708 type:complete len:225 (-) Transcript_5726:1794-2468(-)